MFTVERWLKAVLRHAPGVTDDAVVEIRSWSVSQLETLEVDASVLVRLMRDPTLSSFFRNLKPPRLIRYTAPQLHRLKVLACAAAGLLKEPPCQGLHASFELDAELSRLADGATASRLRGDDNYVLRRGSLLHTDVATSGSEQIEPLSGGLASRAEPVTVQASDGQETNIGLEAAHWEMARLLLDAVRPGRDPMVRLWYQATAAWMQRHMRHDTAHLNHARELFPNDADILFLSGCQHETLAGPAIQAVVRTAILPAGVALDVGSDGTELKEAETFFRRALTLDPNRAEGHLRLGHVLLMRQKPQEAAGELRQALIGSSDDPLLQYLGSLLLGAAEETLDHFEGAHASYARAAALYPQAQSAHLALSALAWRHGDRPGAFREIQPVFESRPVQAERADPWWDYHVAQARNADALLDQLRRPFLQEER
jgi:tetratricopeptide (TPR) repeat protein